MLKKSEVLLSSSKIVKKRGKQETIRISIKISQESYDILTKIKEQTSDDIEKIIERLIIHNKLMISKDVIVQKTKNQQFRERLKILQMMVSFREQGMTQQQIANQLNKRNVPTLSGNGKWHRGTVSQWLKKWV